MYPMIQELHEITKQKTICILVHKLHKLIVQVIRAPNNLALGFFFRWKELSASALQIFHMIEGKHRSIEKTTHKFTKNQTNLKN